MTELRATHPSIAIVDDDTKLVIGLARNLRIAGFEVRTFNSAEEYLVRDLLPHPDLLLVDLRMPGMGGVELRLELNRLGIQTPTVFITGCSQEETMRELERIGSPTCLYKPFGIKSLRHAIDQTISRVVADITIL